MSVCIYVCVYECVYAHVCMRVYKCVFCMLLKCKVPFKLQRTEGCLRDLLSICLSWESEFREQPSLTSTSDSLGIPWVRAEGQSSGKGLSSRTQGPRQKQSGRGFLTRDPSAPSARNLWQLLWSSDFSLPSTCHPCLPEPALTAPSSGLPVETSRELLAVFTSSPIGEKKTVSSVWL